MELNSANSDVAAKNAQQHHHQQQQHEKRQEVEQPRFHVLAVDDSLVDRKLLERLLRVSSYQVTFVDSGDKALEYLGLVDNVDKDNNNSPTTKDPSADAADDTSSSPDNCSLHNGSKVNLIMTDYCMPGMSGYDLLKRVKGSSWKDVPVVVMSSENVPSRINMCLEGGADEFLLKPLQLSDLEKLQPYLLKSLNDNRPCRNFTDDLDKERNANVSENDTSNKCTNNVSKRKAGSSEHSERRTKVKGVAVV